MGTDEVAGDRASQWATKGTNAFMLNVLFVSFCIYIKSLRRGLSFWDTNMRK